MPNTPTPDAMASTAGLPYVNLTPEQRTQHERDSLHAALHRGLEHLQQTYGTNFTAVLPIGAIAERLTEMVENERSIRGR